MKKKEFSLSIAFAPFQLDSRRTIATPMMPMPRNATFVWPGVATDAEEEAAAAAAAETEGEEEIALVVIVGLRSSLVPRPRFCLCEDFTAALGLILLR